VIERDPAAAASTFPVDLEVNWLEGHYEDRGIYVRFIEGAEGIPLKSRKIRRTSETVSEGTEPPIGDDEPLPIIN
jgi:hypothetical protein